MGREFRTVSVAAQGTPWLLHQHSFETETTAGTLANRTGLFLGKRNNQPNGKDRCQITGTNRGGVNGRHISRVVIANLPRPESAAIVAGKSPPEIIAANLAWQDNWFLTVVNRGTDIPAHQMIFVR